ncbi:hypothetical protein Tco_0811814 [Tanacetum coccineum]
MKVINKDGCKVESEMLNLLKINADLFTCDTPLGMNFNEFSRLRGMDDDLCAYEVKLLEPSQALAVILINGKLIRLIDITLKKWLDLKFGDHRKVDKEVMESVVSTWLIRSYKKQFEEYMNIKRQLEVNGIDTDIECDPTNVEFATWLASKFSNHVTMDWYAKNALWIYLIQEKRRDDEWPTCKWREKGHCDGGDLPGMIQIGDMTYFHDYEWYKGLEDGQLKEEALKQKVVSEGS